MLLDSRSRKLAFVLACCLSLYYLLPPGKHVPEAAPDSDTAHAVAYNSAKSHAHLEANSQLALRDTAQKTIQEDLIDDKFSIIISTYNRIEHLHQFIAHYGNGSLPRLDAIFVAWGLGGHDIPDWLESTTKSLNVPVYFERAKRNSLTERFRRPAGMRTSAGFWVDDDLAFRPADIELGFDAYLNLGKEQHRIVGYSGRLVERDRKHTDNWEYRVFTLKYSLVLTNAAFLDTTMLEWFWSDDERIRKGIEYVDELMNCEDILLNFVVSERNHMSPILVDSKDLIQVHTAGISNQPGHYSTRTDCVNAFIEIFGGNPLKTSRFKIAHNTREKSPKTHHLEEQFRFTGKPWAEDKNFIQPED